MQLKNIKKKHIPLFVGIAAFLFLISMFVTFAERLAEHALARGGLADSRIEDIDFGLRDTVLTNIALPRLGLTIREIRIRADTRVLTQARVARLGITGVTWHLPQGGDETAPASSAAATNLRALLARLDTYSDEIDIADAVLAPFEGFGPVHAHGKIYDRGDRYQAQFTLATPDHAGAGADAPLSLSARLNAEVMKKSGAGKAYLELDTLSLVLPAVVAKRVGGWATLELPADPAAAPLLGAQINAGALRVFDIPLTAPSLTLSGDAQTVTAALSARLPEKTGDAKGNGLQADMILSRPQDAAAPETVTARIEGVFEDLDTLGISGVGGGVTLKADLHAAKPAGVGYGALGQFEDIGGSFHLAARNLSLGKVFDRATATLAGTLAFDPARQQLALSSSQPLSLQARRNGGTWGVKADHAGITYDLPQQRAGLDIQALSASSPDIALRDGTVTLLAVLATPARVVEGKARVVVESLHKPALFVPLTVAAEAAPHASRPATTRLQASISGANAALMLTAQGEHDSAARRGHLRGRLAPLDMQAGVRQLSEFFPVSAAYLQDVTGNIRALAAVEWMHKEGSWHVAPRGGLMLRDVAATYGGFPLVGINTVLSFDSLSPPAFTRQQLAIGAFTAGLPLQNGLVTLSLGRDGVLSVHDGRMEMAGGAISVAPFTFDLATQNADIVLAAERLDLRQLFAIAPLEGLTAEGTMAGQLPMTMRAGNLTLANGRLESTGGGVIRYNPREVPAFLQDGANPYMTDLRTALANFAFSSLKMGLSGDVLKEQAITLTIEGKNPDFYGGHPVKLNLNVEGPLQSIVKYAPGSDNIPDALQKQFEQFEDADATVAR